MKYRILLTSVSRNNGDNIYRYYMETNEQGVATIYETEVANELDRKVEELLETYNKSEINIVTPIDYVVDAVIDVNETYVNKIEVSTVGGSITYTMSGTNLYSNEEYIWIMSYDDEEIEVVNTGLTRTLASSEIVKYNSATTVKVKIRKDNYVSEEFTLK